MVHGFKREHHLPGAGKSMGPAALPKRMLLPARSFQWGGCSHCLGHRVKKTFLN